MDPKLRVASPDDVPSPDSPTARLDRAYRYERLKKAYRYKDYLDSIRAIEELRADLDHQLLDMVVGARRTGVTWAAIGEALGTTRQGAFNRFGGLIQRYEQAGLMDPVTEDADLAVDDEEARRQSEALIDHAERGRRQPSR